MDPGTEEAKFEEIYTSNFLDALREERYQGYKHPVICIYHKDDEQREAFVTQHNILENSKRCRPRPPSRYAPH
jgi:hypothetical protein